MSRACVPYPRADSWLAQQQLEWQRTGDARHDTEGAFASIVSMGDRTLYDVDGERQLRRKGKHFLEQLAPNECDATIQRLQRMTRDQAAANEPVPPLSVRAHLPCLAFDVDQGNYALVFVLYLTQVAQMLLRVHYAWRTDAYVTGRTECNEPRSYHLYFPHAPCVDARLHDQLWSLMKAHVGGRLCPFDPDPARSRQLRLYGTTREHGASHSGIHRLLGGFYSDGVAVPLATARADAAALCSVRLGAGPLRQFMQTGDYPCVRTLFAAAALGAHTHAPQGGGVAQPFIDACGGDGARLLLHSADWLLCEQGASTRVLGRVADEQSRHYSVVYRWALDIGNPEAEIVALPSVTVPTLVAPKLIDANSPHRAWPVLQVGERELVPVVHCAPDGVDRDCTAELRLLLLDLPIEGVLNEAGFDKTLARDDGVPSDQFERRVHAPSLRDATGIARAARMLDTQAPVPHAPPFAAATFVDEQSQTLTVAQCGGIDRAVEPQKPFLANGVPPREPLPPGDAEWIVVQAPCDSGKSHYVLEQALAHVRAERGDRVLHLSPRLLLTKRHTADVESKARAMHSAGRLSLATLQHVLGRLHCYKEHQGDADDVEEDDEVGEVPAAAAADHHVVVEKLGGVATWLTCCVDSVRKCTFGTDGRYEFGARVVILDEVRQIVDTLFCAKTTHGKRRKLWLALRTVLAHAELVLVLDRDIDVLVRLTLGSALLHAYRTVSRDVEGTRRMIHIRHIMLAEFQRNVVTMSADKSACFDAIVRDLRAGRKVAVFDANATHANELQVRVTAELAESDGVALRALVIEGATAGAEKRRLAANHKRVLRDVQLFAFTTAIDVGFSIEVVFDALYVFGASWLPWRSLLQGLMRIRMLRDQSPFERRFTLCTAGMSKLPTANSSAQRSMHTIGTVMRRFVCDLARSDAVAESLSADVSPTSRAPTPVFDETDVLVLTAQAVEQWSRKLQRVELNHWCAERATVRALAPPLLLPQLQQQLLSPEQELQLDADKKRRKSEARADVKRQRRAALTLKDTDDDDTRRNKLALVAQYGIGFDDERLCLRAARSEPLMCQLAAAATVFEVENWFNLLAFRAAHLRRRDAGRAASIARADGASSTLAHNGGGIVAETLLGVAAIELTVGLDALLALAACAQPLRVLAATSINLQARVRSPLDAQVLLSADEFFALVAAHGIYRSSGSEALLPSAVASSVRYKGIAFEPPNPDDDGLCNKRRVSFLRRILNVFLGNDVVQPRNNNIVPQTLRSRLWLVRCRLAARLLPHDQIDNDARALLATIADPWGLAVSAEHVA